MESGPDEDDDNDRLQLRRSHGRSFAIAPSLSYWTLHAVRSLTCQCSFLRRSIRNPNLGGRTLPNSSVNAVVPLLYRSFSRGLLSSGHVRTKSDPATSFSPLCVADHMQGLHVNSFAGAGSSPGTADSGVENGGFARFIVHGSNSDSLSIISFGDTVSDHSRSEETCNSVDESSSSSLQKEGSHLSRALSGSAVKCREENKELDSLDVQEMKKRFAKLLLGEDMSGGAQGVSTALAISNAITNLSASIFGELWRLEPLSDDRKVMWRQELELLICVADYIVELAPSWQTFANGSSFEVMVAKPRVDVQTNLPALRKLDAMLLEFLDSCNDTEFWYVSQGVNTCDDNGVLLEERWWLPIPKVAATGLTEEGRKRLQLQRECVNQILKAAMIINSQVLAEMEIPDAYLDALPKSAKTTLGDAIYRQITADCFSIEAVLHTLDLSTEASVVGILNCIEAAKHIWQGRIRRSGKINIVKKYREYDAKQPQVIVKYNRTDRERRALLVERAESLLSCLRQKIPGLRHSQLDVAKIRYNRDVGQSILESYSRVLESLAFNIIARIDDVLFVDDKTKGNKVSPVVERQVNPHIKRGYSFSLSVNTLSDCPMITYTLSSAT